LRRIDHHRNNIDERDERNRRDNDLHIGAQDALNEGGAFHSNPTDRPTIAPIHSEAGVSHAIRRPVAMPAANRNVFIADSMVCRSESSAGIPHPAGA
jgi:hypothetical protein